MVLLLNGGLSDGNPNKRALENAYHCSSLGDTPKFKPRKISAVRDFPLRCGPDAQQINSGPQQSIVVAADEQGNDGCFDPIRSSLGVQSNVNMVVPHSDSLGVVMEGNAELEVPTQSCNVIEANDFRMPAHPEHQEVLDAPVANDILEVEKADDTRTSADPEIQSDEVFGNPLEMEDDTLLDDVVGRVVSVVMDGMNNQFEEVLDVKPMDMKFPEDLERTSIELPEESNGNETLNLLKQLDDANSLAIVNYVPEDVKDYSENLVGRKIILKDETFPCLKNKFCRRRVSAIREFPPYCGINAPPLVEEEQLRFAGGDKSATRIEHSGEAVVTGAGETQVNIEGDGGGDEGRDGRLSPLNRISNAVMVNKHMDCELSVGKEIVIYEPVGAIGKSPSNDASTSGHYREPPIVNGLIPAPACAWRQERVASSSDVVNAGGSFKQKAVWLNKFKQVAKKSTPEAGSLVRPSVKRDYVSICEDDGTSGLPAVRIEEYGENDELHEDLAPGCTLDSDIALPLYGSNSCSGDARSEVREKLQLFQTICKKLLQVEDAKPKPDVKRIDLEAVKIMKNKGIDVAGKKCLGAVPGVDVGDEFHYRVELAFVGVHRLYQAGIDYMKHNGILVAISIVSSGAYANDREDEDSLIYCGQGGNVAGKDKKPEDQKLERGNLALKNSITTKNPVRVIHGFKETKSSDLADSKGKIGTIYVYDGLYRVETYWQEEGKHGNLVYMFKLKKIPGQPELARKEVKKSIKPKLLLPNLG